MALIYIKRSRRKAKKPFVKWCSKNLTKLPQNWVPFPWKSIFYNIRALALPTKLNVRIMYNVLHFFLFTQIRIYNCFVHIIDQSRSGKRIMNSQKLFFFLFFSAFVFFSDGCMKSKKFWIEVNDDIDEIGESSEDYFSPGLDW